MDGHGRGLLCCSTVLLSKTGATTRKTKSASFWKDSWPQSRTKRGAGVSRSPPAQRVLYGANFRRMARCSAARPLATPTRGVRLLRLPGRVEALDSVFTQVHLPTRRRCTPTHNTHPAETIRLRRLVALGSTAHEQVRLAKSLHPQPLSAAPVATQHSAWTFLASSESTRANTFISTTSETR